MTAHETSGERGDDHADRRAARGAAPAVVLRQRPGHYDFPSEEIDTELIDLSDVSLSMLREYPSELLISSFRRVLEQVERPRSNIFASDPPGRAD